MKYDLFYFRWIEKDVFNSKKNLSVKLILSWIALLCFLIIYCPFICHGTDFSKQLQLACVSVSNPRLFSATCPAGQGTDTDGTTCVACPIGKYSAVDALSPCDDCPSGTTTTGTGSTADTECYGRCYNQNLAQVQYSDYWFTYSSFSSYMKHHYDSPWRDLECDSTSLKNFSQYGTVASKVCLNPCPMQEDGECLRICGQDLRTRRSLLL